jgi:K+-sensing histidine kinase KdpD
LRNVGFNSSGGLLDPAATNGITVYEGYWNGSRGVPARTNRIVDRILDFARTAEPALTEVDVSGLLNDLGFLMRAKLKHAGVRLSLRLDSDLPRITGDATQLEQAFLNLSLNAVDAMPGGGELMIRSRSLRPREGGAPDRLIVRFRDTGEGMSAEQQSRLFTSLLLPPAAPVEQPPEPLTSTPPRVVPATVVETPPPAPAP